MRYAKIDEYEVVNGHLNGISLYVQGCPFMCKGCFNQDTWDMNGGKEWTNEVENHFLELAARPYIKRISVLGGEPLADINVRKVYLLTKKLKELFPKKKIWIYSGYVYENIMNQTFEEFANGTQADDYRRMILQENTDILVDGRFEEDKKDLTLRFRGSSNQRIIDIPKTIKKGEIVLWNN